MINIIRNGTPPPPLSDVVTPPVTQVTPQIKKKGVNKKIKILKRKLNEATAPHPLGYSVQSDGTFLQAFTQEEFMQFDKALREYQSLNDNHKKEIADLEYKNDLRIDDYINQVNYLRKSLDETRELQNNLVRLIAQRNLIEAKDGIDGDTFNEWIRANSKR